MIRNMLCCSVAKRGPHFLRRASTQELLMRHWRLAVISVYLPTISRYMLSANSQMCALLMVVQSTATIIVVQCLLHRLLPRCVLETGPPSGIWHNFTNAA